MRSKYAKSSFSPVVRFAAAVLTATIMADCGKADGPRDTGNHETSASVSAGSDAKSASAGTPPFKFIEPPLNSVLDFEVFIGRMATDTGLDKWLTAPPWIPDPDPEHVQKALELMRSDIHLQAEHLFNTRGDPDNGQVYAADGTNWVFSSPESARERTYRETCDLGCYKGKAVDAIGIARDVRTLAAYIKEYGVEAIRQAKDLEAEYALPVLDGARLIKTHGLELVRRACEIGLIPNSNTDSPDILAFNLLVDFGEETVKKAMGYATPHFSFANLFIPNYDGSELETYCKFLTQPNGERLIRAAKKAGFDLNDYEVGELIVSYGFNLVLQALEMGLLPKVSYDGHPFNDTALDLLRKHGKAIVTKAMGYCASEDGHYNAFDLQDYCELLSRKGGEAALKLAKTLGTGTKDIPWTAKDILEHGFAAVKAARNSEYEEPSE